MEDKEFNLDEELKEVREKREREEEQRREQLYDYLGKLRLKKIAQRGIAVGLAGAIMVCGIIALRHKKENPTPSPYSVTEEDNSVTLTRYYTVAWGDTLSGISDETGIPVSRIQSDNDISNPNMIDVNQRLVLNYTVDPEVLDQFTYEIPYEGQNIATIASDYNTNFSTMVALNGDSIVNVGDGLVTTLADTVVVPDFNAINEYNNGNGTQNQR